MTSNTLYLQNYPSFKFQILHKDIVLSIRQSMSIYDKSLNVKDRGENRYQTIKNTN